LEGTRQRLESYVDSLDMEQAAYEAAEKRLKDIRRLLKQCECGTVAELLEMARGAQVVLDQWSKLAGAAPLRCSC
jgi:exonuclease VII small subunit